MCARLVFIGGSLIKNPPANARDSGGAGSIPGSGRSPGRENGNPLQYSCLGNSMDGGTWWAPVHGVAKSQTRQSTRHIIISSTEGEGTLGGLVLSSLFSVNIKLF